jgi:hypothetical protein
VSPTRPTTVIGNDNLLTGDALGGIRQGIRLVTAPNGHRNGTSKRVIPAPPYGLAADVVALATLLWVVGRRLGAPRLHVPNGMHLA